MQQLEPVRKEPLYQTRSERFEWVNCYIKLDGMYRFKDDPAWGTLLKRFRDGNVTAEDVRFINKTSLKGKGHPPPQELDPRYRQHSFL